MQILLSTIINILNLWSQHQPSLYVVLVSTIHRITDCQTDRNTNWHIIWPALYMFRWSLGRWYQWNVVTSRRRWYLQCWQIQTLRNLLQQQWNTNKRWNKFSVTITAFEATRHDKLHYVRGEKAKMRMLPPLVLEIWTRHWRIQGANF